MSESVSSVSYPPFPHPSSALSLSLSWDISVLARPGTLPQSHSLFSTSSDFPAIYRLSSPLPLGLPELSCLIPQLTPPSSPTKISSAPWPFRCLPRFLKLNSRNIYWVPTSEKCHWCHLSRFHMTLDNISHGTVLNKIIPDVFLRKSPWHFQAKRPASVLVHLSL